MKKDSIPGNLAANIKGSGELKGALTGRAELKARVFSGTRRTEERIEEGRNQKELIKKGALEALEEFNEKKDSHKKAKVSTSKGFDRIKRDPEKEADYENLPGWDSLTKRQEDCFLMRLVYLRKKTEIANRLGIHRSTVDEHLAAARKKLDQATANWKKTSKRKWDA